VTFGLEPVTRSAALVEAAAAFRDDALGANLPDGLDATPANLKRIGYR
jgi:hypothetical protein